jgi:hypothetical protein
MVKWTKQALKDKGLIRSSLLKSLICGLEIPRVEKDILIIMVEGQERALYSRKSMKHDLLIAYCNIENMHDELTRLLSSEEKIDGEQLRLTFIDIKID